MKNIIRLIEREVKYLHHSKVIYSLILIVVAVNILSLWGNFTMLQSEYANFLSGIDRYKKLGYDVDQLLQQEMNVKQEMVNGSLRVTTDNPLKFSQSQVGKYLSIVSPKYFIHNSLEIITFLLGPIIFGIFGAYCAFYDYKYKTVQVKAANASWTDWMIAKQIANMAGIAVVFVGALLVTKVVSMLSYSFILNSVDTRLVIAAPLDVNSSIVVKTLVSVMCTSVFSILGFFLVLLSRSVILPTILIVIYNSFIPMLGMYDIKNVFSNIGYRVYEFYSFTFRLVQPLEMNLTLAFFITIGIIICFFGINLGIAKYQSKYIA